jgi:squalene synthase HpnC
MGSDITHMLNRWGPDHCEQVSPEEALTYCRTLTLGHYENFSVLSRVVPERLRDGVSAVYAYCRWADDLSDEAGDPAEASEQLAWWRHELGLCFDGNPRHPVFVALAIAAERYELNRTPFDQLLDAFEQDQTQNRYETWNDLLVYCAGSADPVGHLVLKMSGEEMSEAQLLASNAVCSGLQLVNHWQDVRRDVIERDRIYIPRDMVQVPNFEDRLISTARIGHAPDHEFLAAYRGVVADLMERTRPMLSQVLPLMASVQPDIRPMLWLFAAGGSSILDAIQRAGHETVLYRVSLSKCRKLWLLWLASRRNRAA